MMKSNDDGKDKLILAQLSQSWLRCTVELIRFGFNGGR